MLSCVEHSMAALASLIDVKDTTTPRGPMLMNGRASTLLCYCLKMFTRAAFNAQVWLQHMHSRTLSRRHESHAPPRSTVFRFAHPTSVLPGLQTARRGAPCDPVPPYPFAPMCGSSCVDSWTVRPVPPCHHCGNFLYDSSGSPIWLFCDFLLHISCFWLS